MFYVNLIAAWIPLVFGGVIYYAMVLLVRGIVRHRQRAWLEAHRFDGEQMPRKYWVRVQQAYIGLGLAMAFSIFGHFYVTDELHMPTPFKVTQYEVKVPFPILGDLYLSDYFLATDHDQVLCEEQGLVFVLITHLSQLQGRVRLETAQDALAYVRLLTSETTADSFRPTPRFEITPSIGEGPMPDGFGRMGLVPRGWLEAHHLLQTSVVQTEDGWTIHRTCVEPWGDTSTLIDVYERVRPDGGYTRTEHRFTANPPSDIKWEGTWPGG